MNNMNRRLSILVTTLAVSVVSLVAQDAVVTSQHLTSGPFRALLSTPVLSGDVTLTLPGQGGVLLSSSSALLRGGQSLIGTGVVGTTNNNDVSIVTDATTRITVEGSAGSTQGFVGIRTSSPATQLHINGGLSLHPKAWDVGVAGTTVTIGNSSFVVLTNSPGSPTTITLTDGLEEGQVVVLLYSSAANSVQIQNSGNIHSGGNVTLGQSDTAMYIWYFGRWRNVVTSNNIP